MPNSAGRQLMGVANVLSIKGDQVRASAPEPQPLQIDDPQRGIGRRLEMQNFGIGPDGCCVLLVIGGVDQSGFHAKFRQPLRQELGRAAVDVALGDDVIAAFTSARMVVVIADMPEANSKSRVGALQFRNGFLCHGVRGVAVARIEWSVRRGPDLLFHVGDFERGSLIDRRAEGAVLFAESVPPRTASVSGCRLCFFISSSCRQQEPSGLTVRRIDAGTGKTIAPSADGVRWSIHQTPSETRA